MKALTLATMLLAAAVVQPVLPLILGNPWMVPPLLTAVVAYYALLDSRGWAMAAALLAGCLLDALGRAPLGGSAFILLCGAGGIHAVRAQLYRNSWLTQALLGCGLAMLYALFSALLLWITGNRTLPFRMLARVPLQGVAGLLVTPPVCALARHLDQALGCRIEQGET